MKTFKQYHNDNPHIYKAFRTLRITWQNKKVLKIILLNLYSRLSDGIHQLKVVKYLK